MATVDLSRDSTDFRKRYAGVRMQQGRVLTDDVFNDAEAIDDEDMRRTRVDIIGPVGSPDAGFLPVAPAAPLPVPGKVQFDLSAGTLYLGGLRIEQPAAEPFHLQKDWLNLDPALWPDLPVAGSRIDLVWIEAWQQPVAAEEDKEMFEPALGSADTAMNVRTMRRVAVRPDVRTEECAAAWALATSDWAPSFGLMAPDMEIATTARLQVTYTAPADPGDLCSPPQAGGYLGSENQAIRVQMVSPTQYTWGFDNAAPIYRVQVKQILRNGVLVTQVTLMTEPKDAVHWPLKDQVIEILPWSAALPNGETLAELGGHLARVTASYNPDDQTIEIDTPLPAGFGAQWKTRTDKGDFFDGTPEDDYFFLHVWNRGDDAASPLAIPVASGDLGTTGLHVTFTGGPLRARDYWIIGARPALGLTPNPVVPWRLEDVNGTPPFGVKRYRAPLALIQWTVTGGTATGVVIHDCRRPFHPLTRLRGCCTVTVGDGVSSFGMFTSIQAAVNALPPSGGTVCVMPGSYDESVIIQNRRRIVVHGCDARSRVRARTRRAPEPAFLIVDSEEISIEKLGIESGPRSAVEILRSVRIAVRQCVIQMRDVPTTYQSIFARGDDLVIERNVIDILRRDSPVGLTGVLNSAFDSVLPPPPLVLAASTRGGIQLGGGCRRVRVLGNVIRGGIWNGITLGSFLVRGSDDDVPDKPGTLDPCDPCRPLDETDDGGGNVVVRSAGDLEDIVIKDNLISHMGANGISVARFFNLAKLPILINVKGLHIASNSILKCVRRTINPPSAAMQWMVGYGGIALALATDLRVIDNEIVENGVNHTEPVCGVFALGVENAHIEGNRIVDNGPKTTEEPATMAKNGTRGGIWIWLATARRRKDRVREFDTARFEGVPAAVIRDNLIVVPVGRAITLFAVGGLTIARNRLVSHGTPGRDLDLLATTVLVGNFGISNEWTAGLFWVLVMIVLGKAIAVNPCLLAKSVGSIDPKTNAPWQPLATFWPTGKSLITENHITCDVIDQRGGVALSSVLVTGFDDIGFTDNQCEIESMRTLFITDVLAIAGSVRIADNRMAETWLRALLSGWSLALMNTVTDNQSTHCLRADAPLGLLRVLRDNVNLIRAFCPRECEDNL